MEQVMDCNELFCLNEVLNFSNVSLNKNFNSVFFSCLLLGVSVFFSTLLVSYCGFNSKNENKKNENKNENDDSDNIYEYKYSEFFEDLNEKKINLLTNEEKINMNKKYITDTTPNGNVIMTYYFNEKDPELSSFQYYCNDRNIFYKYLDTVARKFVITHECPELYLYLKAELIKEVEKNKQNYKREKELLLENNKKQEQEQEKMDSVFATFKNYKQDQPKTEKAKLRSLLVSKNRYTRIGTIEDYEKTLLPKNDTDIKNISFADYKKQYLLNK